MRLLCAILGLLLAAQLTFGQVQERGFRTVGMEDILQLGREGSGFPPLPLATRTNAQVMSLTEYRAFLKKNGIGPLPVSDLTVPAVGLARLVGSDLVSLTKFDFWIKYGSPHRNPMPNWYLLEGQVAEVLAEGAIVKLTHLNKKTANSRVFLRISPHILPLRAGVKLGCYARHTGGLVDVWRDTPELLPVYNYGEEVPSPLLRGYRVRMPIQLPLENILRLAPPPNPEPALIDPTLIPDATGLQRTLANDQSVNLQPLHEWMELRGIGPKPLPDWFRVQGVISNTTPVGYWLVQTMEDFRAQNAHVILRCPPDVPDVFEGRFVNLYAHKTGELIPLPGYANLVPVYEYDGRTYSKADPLATPSRLELTDTIKFKYGLSSRPPPDTKGDKIAALTQQLNDLNREYITLTNSLASAEHSARSGPVGVWRNSLGSRGIGNSMAYDVANSPTVLAARKAVAANRQSYANVEAEIHRLKADTPENRAAQADKLLEWQHQRAAQGSATAQYDLGLRYLEGKGVAKDEVEALRLLRAAAAQGHTQASDKLKVLEKLSPAQP